MNRDAFVCYRSFYEAIDKLPVESQLCAYKKLMEYAINWQDVQCDDVLVDMIFWLMKPNIDSNNDKYTNGKKGGRPKKKPEVIDKKNHRLKKTESNVDDNEEEKEKEDVEEKEETTNVDSKAVQSSKKDLLSQFTTSTSEQGWAIKSEAPPQVPPAPPHWNASVNEVIEAIREKVEWYWLIYDWSMDRNFASHVNSKKLLAEAQKYQCKSGLEYILYVIDASFQSEFWRGKICWPKSAYQKRATVLNGFIAEKAKEKDENDNLPIYEAR